MKALRTAFECNQTRCRKNPDLAHATSEHLANAAAAFDERTRSDDHRADRRTESLAQTELHGIEFLRYIRNILTEVCGRIEDSRTIEMHRNTRIVRSIADFVCNLRWVDCSTGHVVGILE
jgi:hypothetical protein